MSTQLALVALDVALIIISMGVGSVMTICYQNRHSAFGIR